VLFRSIISGGKGTASEKMAAMKKAGIHVVESPAEIGFTMKKALEKKKSKKAKGKSIKKKVTGAKVKGKSLPAKRKSVKKVVKKSRPVKKRK